MSKVIPQEVVNGKALANDPKAIVQIINSFFLIKNFKFIFVFCETFSQTSIANVKKLTKTRKSKMHNRYAKTHIRLIS